MASLPFAKIYAPVVSTYPALLRHLYNVNTMISDSLPAPNSFSKVNTQKLYDAIGRPLDRIPSVLVGGTNGKGSTCLKIASGLQVSGFKTGLFVSPHISSYRERVQINGALITEPEIMDLMPRVLDICLQQEIPATFFELTFALACLQFEASSCDTVVLEVGVGGEWDATNVVAAALSIICSVDLDHTRFLGPTVEAIAANKAGIFKSNRPALWGPGCPQSVMEQEASRRSAIAFPLHDALQLPVLHDDGMTGVPSAECMSYTSTLNSRLALAGLALLKASSTGILSNRGPERISIADEDQSLYKAFSTLQLESPDMLCALSVTAPCRWERFQVPVPSPIPPSNRAVATESGSTGDVVSGGPKVVEVVLDLGHNPAAITALVRRAQQEFAGKRVRIIYGMSRDKNANQCIQLLLSVAQPKDVYFIQSKNFRAISVDEMRQRMSEVAGECEVSTLSSTDLVDIVPEVLQICTADEQGSVLLICGSAFFMPQVRGVLGVVEPRDDLDLCKE